MEIFKTDIQKKGFERFQKENLIGILKCEYCQKAACESWHNKFLVSCKYCREAFCKPCHNFNIEKETLIKEVDTVAKDYIENFIKDFLYISNQTLEKNFQVSEVVPVPVEKTFNVIEEDSTGITIEIDLVEHQMVLEDLTKTFFTKKN